MTTGQVGKGSKRRPRDRRYCTREQYAERFDAIDWGKTSRVRTIVFVNGEPQPGPMLALDDKGLRIEAIEKGTKCSTK